jgi:hypothetical protein
LFGSVFSSHKPQFVGGKTITPILEPGDVGVLCQVLRYQDSFERFEPTNNYTGEGGTTSGYDDRDARRIIQLDCKASTRFRIEKILQTGFGDKPNSLPFILVEASIFNDELSSIESKEAHEIIQRLEAQDYIQRYKSDDEMDLELLSFNLLASISTRLNARETLPLLSTVSTKDRLLFLEKMYRFGYFRSLLNSLGS